MRYLRAFGAFLYDFLIGDRPELFVGSIVALGLVWAAIGLGLDAGLGGWVLVVGVLVVGGIGVVSGSRPGR